MNDSAAVRAPYVPIVTGTIAFWVGKKNPPGGSDHTHKWMVYVRHADDKDLSYAVSKVSFKLHPSFPNHVRDVSAPPYQCSETGWGEFEIGITLHLRDPAAKPVELIHKLKLYPSVGAMEVDKPVVDEHYDEVVFNELPADPDARSRLLAGPLRDSPPYTHGEYFGTFSAEADLARIHAARQFVRDRKIELQDRLLRAQVEADREQVEVHLLGVT